MDTKWDDLWNFCIEHFNKKMHGSDHGEVHWRRVERNALRLAIKQGGDQTFVRLFAVLHDCCRENEFEDSEHGDRAAKLARKLRGTYFDLDDDRFNRLCFALSGHDRGERSEDLDIGICWDADRLDLVRVGIIPMVSYFSTKVGIEECRTLVRGNHEYSK